MYEALTSESEVQRRLGAANVKATSARIEVLDVLQGYDHLSPEQVHLIAQRHLDGLSLSTVYRTLDTLVEAGLVGHTSLMGSSRSYYLAEHGGHTHLTCRACGRQASIDSSVLTAFAELLVEQHSFHLDAEHLVLTGRCGDCLVR